ncbi:TolC family protein [Massilia yuzhufengensis]|uniref:Outer membrane protein TolC n=1 Tax=Massilia yuzhufengensis TaxID=1164594 RepID=A0A1I1PHJ4_9BURK|nr:TolC family protein [Massilia yuzhufengensis]SFD09309.1 Outer membrane protein TolC [Massilia yuzhufengensis]
MRAALFLPCAALVLAGCASPGPQDAAGQVAALVRERTGATPRLAGPESAALDREIDALLAAPLAMDSAVHIALLKHPGLQASYWEVGIAQADLAQAARLRNPSLGLSRLSGNGGVEIERAVSIDVAGLLTMPLRRRMETRRFEAARLSVAGAIEGHALATRKAWIEAVAAQESLAYARQVNAATEAGAELMGRMAKAGNASALDVAREQAAHAEAAAGVLRASRAAGAAREHLTRQLGLWGAQAGYTLPERLPALPAAPRELARIEALALERRLDVQAARLAAQHTAADLGLTRTTRFVNVLDLGYHNKSETGADRANGYEIGLELPLFDWGGARVARAEAVYMQAVQRVADTAITARSEAREAYLGYRAGYDLARHYRDEVIPLRRKIGDETLLRYNGMLASPFELLADAREQAQAVSGAIDALKEFWLAEAALEGALGGRLDGPAHQPTNSKEEQQ